MSRMKRHNRLILKTIEMDNQKLDQNHAGENEHLDQDYLK